jgi:hypothetical protein
MLLSDRLPKSFVFCQFLIEKLLDWTVRCFAYFHLCAEQFLIEKALFR